MNHQVDINFENPAADHVAPISAAFTTKARNPSVNGCYFPALFETVWSVMKIASKGNQGFYVFIFKKPLEESLKMKNN